MTRLLNVVYVLYSHIAVCRRVLLKASRKLAQQYYMTHMEDITTAQLVQRIANVMQEYTQQGSVSLRYKQFLYCNIH